MPSDLTEAPSPTTRALVGSVILGAACFFAAHLHPLAAGLVIGHLAALIACTGASSALRALALGLLAGLLAFAPQLWFFTSLFGGIAVGLWLLLAAWIGLFTAIGHVVRKRLGRWSVILVIPVLWTGLEYFRSELYYLRFSWLGVGLVVPPGLWLPVLGAYGTGWALTTLTALVLSMRSWSARIAGGTLLVTITVASNWLPSTDQGERRSGPRVAGVQLEFSRERVLRDALDRVFREHAPELLVLSEYTFQGPPPRWVRDWCRDHECHLIAGGKRPLPGDRFANTAFVVDSTGEIAFEQTKSVPVQFFSDGEPAEAQHVWRSPWGRIGICICYDLGYTRVVDELIRQGAEALVVPTMDLQSWGRREHELHARVAPVRSREYGVSIFRVCSSGISQLVRCGRVIAEAPFPGQGATLAGTLAMRGGSLPLDRRFAPWMSASVPFILLALWLVRRRPRHGSAT